MKREIKLTSDGSTTIHLPDWEEHYHSIHGAIQEAYHVYIAQGLKAKEGPNISILEMGFGTGLNCFITFLERANLLINYVGVEAYPVVKSEYDQLNYVTELHAEQNTAIFETLHSASWEKTHAIRNGFTLTKRKQLFKDVNDVNSYDVIYFDAFAPNIQPELWTEAIFKNMYRALKINGILVTYAAKGDVKRALKAVGFSVKRLPGPKGKWHMLRATKN